MPPTLDDLAARVVRLERHVFGSPPEPPTAPTSHTVVAGDTLRALAVRYSLTVAELVAWNDLADPDVISVGQVLRLTAPAPAPEPDPEPQPSDPVPVPGNLRATVDQAARTVLLAWDAVPDATYRVYEAATPTGFGPIEGNASMRGPLLAPHTYRYSVTAVVDGLESERSAEVLAALGEQPVPEPEPDPQPDPEPPTPDPQPDASPIPADAVLLLDGRFANTGWDAYDSMQNGDYNGDPDGYRGDRTVLVDDPVKGKVCRFTVSPGDVPNFGGGERSEVASHLIEARTREGDERWYEFSVMFEEGFRPPRSEWCIWMQWHPGSGSPPFTLSVLPGGEVTLFDRWEDPEVIASTVDAGVWHDYVVHARFSNNASNGWVEVWRDGELVVPRTNHQTMNSDKNYLKLGLYRSSETHTQVIYHTGPRIYAA